MNTALRLLARRDHSRLELRRKLSQRAFGADQIGAALAECERLDYLDDARFCSQLTSQLRRKGYGVLRITQMLREKGLAGDLIAESLRRHCSETNQVDDCRRALAKKRKARSTYGDDGQRLYRYLSGRGFTTDAIRRVLSEE